MSVPEMSTNNSQSYIYKINMNNQTLNELKALAKQLGLRGQYKLRKAHLVSLLEDAPQRPARRQRGPLSQVTVLPKSEAIDNFEQEEMGKNRSLVKKN